MTAPASLIHQSGDWRLEVTEVGMFRVASKTLTALYTSPIAAIQRYERETGEEVTL